MSSRTIQVSFEHRVHFSRSVFSADNRSLRDLIAAQAAGRRVKVLAFIDDQVAFAHPTLATDLQAYLQAHQDIFSATAQPILLPGGEACKNDFRLVEKCWKAINDAGLDRHSYVFIIGGGAVLDLVGFAASTAHRGIRHIRFPTTSLSQGDGGVGVKNGVNYLGKKNWVGSFAVPFAVINDFAFLDSLPARERRGGLIEAIKVALIRDADFYHELEAMAPALAQLASPAIERAVQRSAEVHVAHICEGGDPFEMGSARPLDFGHWVAHKLEQVSRFQITHGEAVAIGIAVDLLYSVRVGILDRPTAERILQLIEAIGFTTYAPQLLESSAQGEAIILAGLEEFREHLGGELTITLVPSIGQKIEVHEMDRSQILAAVKELRDRHGPNASDFVPVLLAHSLQDHITG
jgi:3-dehydroquinate synthase